MSLASLHSCRAFFLESDSAPCALPLSSSQGPVRKKQRGRRLQCAEMSELTLAHTGMMIDFLKEVGTTAILNGSRADQRPSAVESDMVSFGRSEDEILDDNVSLAASDGEELSDSIDDPAPPQNPVSLSQARTLNFSVSCQELWTSWAWSGHRRRSPPAAAWMSDSCLGAIRPLVSQLHRSSRKFTKNSPDRGAPPTQPVYVLPLHQPSLR